MFQYATRPIKLVAIKCKSYRAPEAGPARPTVVREVSPALCPFTNRKVVLAI